MQRGPRKRRSSISLVQHEQPSAQAKGFGRALGWRLLSGVCVRSQNQITGAPRGLRLWGDSMTSAKGEPGSAGVPENPGLSGGPRRRPPPTIDLEATEVARRAAASSQLGPTSEPAEASADGGPTVGAHGAAGSRFESLDWRSWWAAIERAAARWPQLDRPGPLVVAALAGAAALALVLTGLWSVGLLGSAPGDSTNGSLATKVANLERQVQELAGHSARNSGSSADPKVVSELASRVSGLEQAQHRLDAVEQRLGRLESAPAAAADPAWSDRLARAETATKSNLEAVADMRRQIDDLSASVRDVKAGTDRALEAAQKSAAGNADAAAVDRGEINQFATRVAALERTANAVETKLQTTENAAGAAERVAKAAFVTAVLRDAVEHGGPFKTELAAAKPLLRPADLATLEPLADAGVPTAAVLAGALSKLIPEVLSEGAPVSQKESILDRLQANAAKLVRVRPVGEASGDEPAALLARAEARAGRDDMRAALNEIAKLPSPTRSRLSDWTRSAESRVSAIDTVRRLAATSLEALGQSGP